MHYSLARATFWNLAGYLYLIIASLISTPIFIHALGINAYGQYLLIMAVVGIASAFDLGLSQAVVRALSRESVRNTRSLVWSTSLLLFTLTGIVASLLSLPVILSFNVSHTLPSIICLIILSNTVLSHFLTLPQSLGRFGWFNVKTFVVGSTVTFLTAYLAYLGQGLEVIIASQLLSYLLTLGFLIIFSTKYFPFTKYLRPDKKSALSLLSFGWRNQIGKLVGQTGAVYGKFLLATISPLAISAYSIAQALVMKAVSSINQLTVALYPASSKNAHSPALRSLYYRLQISLFGLSLLGIIAYYIFGFSLLSVWLQDPSLASSVHSVLNIFIWYFAILILTPLPSTILDSHGRPGLTSLFATLTVALEISLAIILLPSLGLLSPPVAGLIAVSLTTPALLVVTERVLLAK